MTALRDLVGCLDRLLFGLLYFNHFLIYGLEIIIFILVYYLVKSQEHLHLVANVLLQIIQDDSQRHRVVDVLLLAFVVLLHVQE